LTAASKLTVEIGTEEVEYDKIDWAGAKTISPGLAIEQKLTISVSKIVSGSVNAVRGNRDKPEYVKHSTYPIQIKHARDIYVVLYDVEAQRGWLVDGASALLHLVQTQVTQEPYGGAGSLFNLNFNYSTFNHPGIDGGPNAAADILNEIHNMSHIILREFSSYADETISIYGPKTILTASEGFRNIANDSGKERKIIYKTTCFKDLVTHMTAKSKLRRLTPRKNFKLPSRQDWRATNLWISYQQTVL
jgi:hypothetical protein